MEFNSILFKAINGLAHQNILLDKLMIFMSGYAPDIFMMLLAAVYIIGVVKKNSKLRGIVVDTFIVVSLSLFIGYIIGLIWYVPRPFVNNKVNLLLPHVVDASFPSDHAIGTMGIAVGISKYNKAYGGLLALISIIVGISRVFVGHHYPSDILGGYVIVFIVSFLYDLLLRNRVKTLYFKVEEILAKRFPILKRFL